MKADFLADCVVKLSIKLLSPQSLFTDDLHNMIDFPAVDKSSNPDPSDCLVRLTKFRPVVMPFARLIFLFPLDIAYNQRGK